MTNGITDDEKNLHNFYREVHDAYKRGRLDEARAGIALMSDELHYGNGRYGIMFYAAYVLRATLLNDAIDNAVN